jgi:hypothetical protein
MLRYQKNLEIQKHGDPTDLQNLLDRRSYDILSLVKLMMISIHHHFRHEDLLA